MSDTTHAIVLGVFILASCIWVDGYVAIAVVAEWRPEPLSRHSGCDSSAASAAPAYSSGRRRWWPLWALARVWPATMPGTVP